MDGRMNVSNKKQTEQTDRQQRFQTKIAHINDRHSFYLIKNLSCADRQLLFPHIDIQNIRMTDNFS